MSNRHLIFLVTGLALTGIVTFTYRLVVLKFPLLPQTTADSWNVEVKISFEPSGGPLKVTLFIPKGSKVYSIVDESFISRGYGVTTKKKNNNRQIVWSLRKARGYQILYYRAAVGRIEGKELTASKAPTIDKPDFEGSHLIAAETLLSEIREGSADTETMVAALIERLNNPQGNSSVTLLLGKRPTSLKKMEIAVSILSLAGIPARVVQGVRLAELQRDAPLIQWLEVYEKEGWLAYNPLTASLDIPDDYLPWWRGTDPLVALKGGKKLHTQISISLKEEAALIDATMRGSVTSPLLHQFSLLNLPIETQAVYGVLLMLPIGAFLLVMLRNCIGLATFGTFMPVLIALAFRETRLLWGIVLFSAIVSLGLSIRFYFEHLKLLLVPRLAAVLIVVILLMVFLSILTHKLGFERGVSVALFPIVIMTMTIERMSIVWEERGAPEALKQGLGSLLAAAAAYYVMSIEYLQHLIFVFPEILLILLAVTILLGRYTGYRLLELWRFKALVKGG